MKILAVSDIELPLIYGPNIRQRFSDVDLAIGCGDLPYYYLEYIVSTLDVPLYFVRGNHAHKTEISSFFEERSYPWGADDLHRSMRQDPSSLLLAGIQGCLRYNNGPYQYTQEQMWALVLSLVPRLMLNKLLHGRYLDIFVSHAPPWQIQDMEDRPHQGIKAFRWLLKVFQPALHLHGHIHIYRQCSPVQTMFGNTRVMNVFGYREITLDDQALAHGKIKILSPKLKDCP
ncbi:MAG: metallophosphoesterase [Anaerolineaceae bacterium]|jgi:Icc-related predicted phosphoesterase|nr:metallophosphoesterase [Anaerolineaceae bacterium]